MKGRSVTAPNCSHADMQLHTADHVVSTRQADATILLDLRRGKYYTLNAVGGRIWTLLAEGATVLDIIDRLVSEFDVSEPQISTDVTNFIEQLDSSNLIADGKG